MKITKYVFVLLFSVLILSCIGYGDRLKYDKTDVYYTMKVEKTDAEKLGNYLVSSGFTDGKEKSVQLSKNDENGNYQFKMVTSKEATDSKSYEVIFRLYAQQISDSVFNKQPVEFHICDNTFNTLKVIYLHKPKSTEL
ncbi:hypothetical protein DUT90_11175 [Polaribacter sp. WD7]|uniref:hypothetical protein n=1 Tax=Polaribacter sp. WD7 TaxID=2269061 RepID=UPI000DF2D929|nr:hypothetical protein [Polaribacter sp. WD7]RCS26325.1 hypothetical protein DUT90_11175 [Polaribacter sp. WD7]